MANQAQIASPEIKVQKLSEVSAKVFSSFAEKDILEHYGYAICRIRKSRGLLDRLNNMALCRIDHTHPVKNSFTVKRCSILTSSAFVAFLETDIYARCKIYFFRDSGTVYIQGLDIWDKQITLCFSEHDMSSCLMQLAGEVGRNGKTKIVDPCLAAYANSCLRVNKGQGLINV